MPEIQLSNPHPRMAREARTVEAMIGIYCRGQHGTRGDTLCAGCADLLRYAGLRLEKCPFQEQKTTCSNCPVHCYSPDRRAQVRAVMRYAGPRMILRHPVLAFYHLVIDSRREKPGRAVRKAKTA